MVLSGSTTGSTEPLPARAAFAPLFDAAPEPVWIVTDDGRCAYANPSACRVEGARLDDLLGEPWLARHATRAAEALRDAVERARLDGHGSRLAHGSPSGGEAWFDTGITPVSGGVLVIAVDRPPLRREPTPNALVTLATILDCIQDAVIAADNAGRITFFNPAAARLSGWTQEEAIGRAVESVLRLVDDPRRSRPRGVIDVVLRRTARDGITHHTVLLTRSGERVPVATSGAPVVDADGARLGAVLLAKDVTAELSINTRAQSLARLEALGRLAGGIAHDFNNLLSVISGYAQMVLDDLPPASPARADVEEMRSASERAAGLTRQLLAFSRQQLLRPVVIDPSELVRGVGRMLTRVLGEDIRLTVRAPAGLGRVRVDPTQFEQIVMNLAINARDAMPVGGDLALELSRVDLDEAHVALHPQSRLGPHLTLAVTDTGVGMDAETRARIFEPFFTTKEKGKGTGLGLATVYGIVRQSGGNIWVYSEPGLGTTFKVYLPVCVEPLDDDSAPAISLPPQATGVILVVEDEAPLRALLERILLRAGYAVHVAADGAQALRTLSEHDDVDVLLTDVVMPAMSGPELVARAKALRPGLRVMLMSGYTDHAVTQQGLVDMGATIIEKPLSAGPLLKRVRELLGDSGPPAIRG